MSCDNNGAKRRFVKIQTYSLFLCAFCLHDNLRTPTPIVCKFMSVINDCHLIQQDPKNSWRGIVCTKLRHNDWWLYAGIYTCIYIYTMHFWSVIYHAEMRCIIDI